MEEVKLSFYKIASCGYYPWGDHKNPQFGSVGDILGDLQRWGRGKRLAHTKTFDPADGGNHLPAYLVDVTQSGDAWLLTLWNESHNTDGTVTSINGQAAVGNADVSETEVEDGHIPGHATYFWFLPNQGCLASVRFQHPTTGVSTMAKYVQSFAHRFSSYVVHDEQTDGDEIRILGYRQDEGSSPLRLKPRFKVEIFSKPGRFNEIVSNAARIRKLKKRSKLNLAIHPERSMFQRLLAGVHLADYQTVQQEAAILYEVEVNGLQEAEASEIIQQWRDEESDDTDYGFVFRGESATHWLAKEYVRDTLELNVERDNAELVRPQSLLRELSRQRSYLLGLLK